MLDSEQPHSHDTHGSERIDFDAQTLAAAGKFLALSALPAVAASTEVQYGDGRLRLVSDGHGKTVGHYSDAEGTHVKTVSSTVTPKLDIEL